MAKKTTKFTTKLGKNKGTARSRIWLQGKRLIEAGFKPGSSYGVTWYSDKAQLFLNPQPEGYEMRKVSGKGEMPIIDIVGARVVDVFGCVCDRVDVTFHAGQINIVRHNPKS
jgi:hypothetical protein